MNIDSKIINRKIIYDLIILILSTFVIAAFKFLVQPYQRGFFCNDESLKYVFKDSTISSQLLITFSIFIPLFIIGLFEINKCRNEDELNRQIIICNLHIPVWLWNTYCALEIFLFGVIIQQLTTDIGKYSIGRLRPHFFDICNPSYKCKDFDYEYHTNYVCLNNNNKSVIKDVRLSFPSGHASLSMYGMIYLIIYLQRNMTNRSTLLFKHILQFVAFAATLYTGYSRVTDHKHHWTDVLAGFFIGFVIAYVTTKFIKNRFDYKQIIPMSNNNQNNQV